MENSGEQQNGRNYVLDNSRGYQTRGRSMGPGRYQDSGKKQAGVPEENL